MDTLVSIALSIPIVVVSIAALAGLAGAFVKLSGPRDGEDWRRVALTVAVGCVLGGAYAAAAVWRGGTSASWRVAGISAATALLLVFARCMVEGILRRAKGALRHRAETPPVGGGKPGGSTNFLGFTAVLAAAALLAFPESAAAFDMDYYTYKGFKETTSALKKIALIFSDSNYKGLAATAAVVGLGVAGIRFYASLAVTGLKGGMLGWVVPPIIGMVLFIAFIVPKGRLAVYDPVLNRSQIIDGIPDGVVLIVGGLNAIERGMVDMIGAGGAAGVGGGPGPAPAPASEGILGVLGDVVDASAADYTLQAQGVGFNAIAQLFKYPAEIDEDLRGNVYHYIKDCVTFEIQNKKQGLTLSSLKKSPNFVDEFAKAASPAIFTVTTTETVNWAGADGESQPKRTTCQSLWQKIAGPLTSAGTTFEASVAKMCVQAGFEATGSGVAQCRKSVEGLLTVIFGPSASGLGTAEFFRQWEMAEMMRKVLLGDNLDAKAKAKTNTQAMSGMIAGGMQAHEWMPSVRAVTTAIAFGMLPFTLLFLPTPLFGRSVSLAAGFNVWLAAWGVTDATIHSALMSQAADVFAATRPNGMGMASMLVFPDATEKALALFSNARWMSMTLAGVFAMALVKFGGYAFTSFTQSMSGQAQSASAAGGAMATPEGQAGALKQTTTALPDMWNQSRWDLADYTTKGGLQGGAEMGRALETSDRMGGPVAAGDALGHAQAVGDAGLMARGSTVGFGGATAIATESAREELGREAGATAEERERFGRESTEMSTAKTRGEYRGLEGRAEDVAEKQAAQSVGRAGQMSVRGAGEIGAVGGASELEKAKTLKVAGAKQVSHMEANASLGKSGAFKDGAEARDNAAKLALKSLGVTGGQTRASARFAGGMVTSDEAGKMAALSTAQGHVPGATVRQGEAAAKANMLSLGATSQEATMAFANSAALAQGNKHDERNAEARGQGNVKVGVGR